VSQKVHDQYRGVRDMSIDFRNKFDYNKKEPFTFTYTILEEAEKNEQYDQTLQYV
jgi:hypothetical protein